MYRKGPFAGIRVLESALCQKKRSTLANDVSFLLFPGGRLSVWQGPAQPDDATGRPHDAHTAAALHRQLIRL